ncbi:MAG: hypothetical protein Q4P43_08315, partial [Corynebacterium sphenisci]|nr:hypothetical protein [Corynebacterium sphenisci]
PAAEPAAEAEPAQPTEAAPRPRAAHRAPEDGSAARPWLASGRQEPRQPARARWSAEPATGAKPEPKPAQTPEPATPSGAGSRPSHRAPEGAAATRTPAAGEGPGGRPEPRRGRRRAEDRADGLTVAELLAQMRERKDS